MTKPKTTINKETITITSIFILCVILLFIGIIVYDNEIKAKLDKIQLELDNKPNQKCWNETTYEAIEIAAGRMHKDIWLSNEPSYYWMCGLLEHPEDDLKCEEGVHFNNYSYYSSYYENCGNETKICFKENVERKCEIIFK